MKKVLLIIGVLVFVVVVIFITVSFAKSPILVTNTENHGNSTILTKNMKISSIAFGNNTRIPVKYTCNGQDINPPLQFVGVPQDAKSLVLIVDDPDAPMGTWVHWVVYNIEPSVKQVNEKSVPQGGIEAKTSVGKPSYSGPCPPSGTHRYFFKVYALDTTLVFERRDQVDKRLVEEKMKGHVIDQAEMIGLYSQQK
ncbi:YbhB/YbcL family Raf kinase inhibitor-like protein [Dictyobacter formicarum]|uniref:PBP family phospholipid-binding protein n=1 Tax=Dictyobacter formicarum TaxID=2778368 RepID=A0ABQ3VG87_9CHLR|nr:YbhB/YbcL family Raf kinase inhibitor-like protein [Dictyobacter formicarum]GHO85199.1 PBP family phospholipid-binding protein [Dictyobacter formicarum]